MKARGVLVLFLLWLSLNPHLTIANLVVGLVVASSAAWFSGHLRPVDVELQRFRFGSATAWLWFLGVFAVELVRSNWQVARQVVAPRQRFQPGVLELPLALRKSRNIVLYSSAITLTPGVVALELSSNMQRLYIHALDARDVEAVKRSAARLERAVLRVERQS